MSHIITQQDITTLSQALTEPSWVLQKRLSCFDEKYASQIGDGDFSVSGAQVSCEDAKVYHFDSALKEKKLAGLVRDYMFMRSNAIKHDTFANVTSAAFTDGYIVMIPKSSQQSFELLISSTEEYAMTYCLVVVEDGAQVDIHETIHAPTTHSVIIEYVVASSAQCKVVAFEGAKGNQSLYVLRQMYVHADAKGIITQISKGDGIIHSTTNIYLLESNAHGEIYNAVRGEGRGTIELSTSIYHETEHTISNMFAREVLADMCKVSHCGNVVMLPTAKGSKGYQKQEALLLSNNVKYNPVPNLDIQTHDVQCSHGVSATRFSDISAFYCMSRGLTYEEALELYVASFYDDALIQLTESQRKKILL